jgi:hypothetical protein
VNERSTLLRSRVDSDYLLLDRRTPSSQAVDHAPTGCETWVETGLELLTIFPQR